MPSPIPTLHMRRGAPTAAVVRQLMDYCPDTGVFRHKRPSRGPLVHGAVAGSLDNLGYRKIGVNGTQYKAHQLAWLHHYGEWAGCELDHANGTPDDNRIANLRKCSRRQNQRNRAMQKNNTYGTKGVEVLPGGKFRARICVDRKSIHIGCFDTEADACAARAQAEIKHFGVFARQEVAA